MIRSEIARASRAAAAIWLIVALCAAQAQPAPAHDSPSANIEVLFVSDIHFEPFWDPAKAPRLLAAPVGEWNAILSAPDTTDRAARFDEIQKKCATRGADSSYTLYQSSLKAIHAHAAHARFMVLSGDLMSHEFSCKFAAVFPKPAPGDYRAFSEKIVDYVLAELRAALPEAALFAALGNNDSDCGDYQIDANGEFLSALAPEFTRGFSEPDRQQAAHDFAMGGYYSARLPAPVKNTRLLVLDDLFMSRRYQTCAGKTDPAPAAAQIAWLKQQFERARQSGEKIWVMSHIPPGVDPYGTAHKALNICGGAAPQMYLSSEKLPETMAEYGDVIQLAVFAHTHQDEMRLLMPDAANASHGPVPVKMIASISPVDGNNPSFTIGRVDPTTGTLTDYRVIAASNQTGIATTWAEEYDFARAYREPAFTAATLTTLLAGFKADPTGRSPESQSYLRNYMTGVDLRGLGLIWQPYVCALTNDSATSFTSCVCKK